MKRYFKMIFFIALLIGLCSCHHISYISKDYNTEIILDSNYQINDNNLLEIVTKDKSGNTIVKRINKDSVIISIESFDNETERNHLGGSQYYFPNGKLKKSVLYRKKNLYSEVKIYHSNGLLKREDYFIDSRFLKGSCFDSLGNHIKHTEYEKEPIMNLSIFSKCLIYPDSLRKEGIEEDVNLHVFINKFGKIVKLKFDKSNSKSFVDEAIKCLKKLNEIQGAIIPAIIDEERIDSWINIPVRYRLTLFGF